MGRNKTGKDRDDTECTEIEWTGIDLNGQGPDGPDWNRNDPEWSTDRNGTGITGSRPK